MNNYDDLQDALPWYTLGMELYEERIAQEKEREYQINHCPDCGSHRDEPCDSWCSISQGKSYYDQGYKIGYHKGYDDAMKSIYG